MKEIEQLAYYALETANNLIKALRDNKGDFGGPENEIAEWIDEIRKAGSLFEHIMNVTA